MPLGEMIGIIVGGAVFLCLVCVGFFRCRNGQRAGQRPNANKSSSSSYSGGYSSYGGGGGGGGGRGGSGRNKSGGNYGTSAKRGEDKKYFSHAHNTRNQGDKFSDSIGLFEDNDM